MIVGKMITCRQQGMFEQGGSKGSEGEGEGIFEQGGSRGSEGKSKKAYYTRDRVNSGGVFWGQNPRPKFPRWVFLKGQRRFLGERLRRRLRKTSGDRLSRPS